MDAWDAFVPALAILSVVAGVAKVVRPTDTARALRAAGLPLTDPYVRIGAGAEAAVGGAVLAGTGRWAVAMLAAAYLAFGGFVSAALVRRWPLASCGCFGEPDTPPTVLHAAVCFCAAGVLAGTAAGSARPSGVWTAVTVEGPYRAGVFVLLSLVAAYVLYLAMSAAPRLAAARAALRGTDAGRAGP
jgi:hypothetical protein